MDNNLPNTQLDDQKMENLRKRTKLSKYIMIAGGVCLGIVVLMILLNGGTPVSYTHLDVYKRQVQAFQ